MKCIFLIQPIGPVMHHSIAQDVIEPHIKFPLQIETAEDKVATQFKEPRSVTDKEGELPSRACHTV